MMQKLIRTPKFSSCSVHQLQCWNCLERSEFDNIRKCRHRYVNIVTSVQLRPSGMKTISFINAFYTTAYLSNSAELLVTKKIQLSHDFVPAS